MQTTTIILKSTKSVIDDLYSSISTPKQLKGKNIDDVIKSSKLRHFSTYNLH